MSESNTVPKAGPGRPKGSLSRGSLKQQKLKNILLKHMEPYAVEAIETQVKLMRSDESPATVKLQASKFIIEKIGSLINDSYEKEKGQEDQEDDRNDEPTGAILSFTVLDGKKA